MADKTIGELPAISSLDASSLFVAEQSGQAVKVSGKQLTDFSNVETTAQVEQAKASAQEAKTAQAAAEAAILRGPVIQNGTWWVYNQTEGAYQDTGIKATGPQGIPGPTSSVNGISPDASGNITLGAANILRSDGVTNVEAALTGMSSVLSSKPNPNLLDNWYFGNPVDQLGGYVVPPDMPYYNESETELVEAGTTDKYYTAKNGVNNNVFRITIEGTNYMVPKTYGVRGYIGTLYGLDMWRLNGNNVAIITDGNVKLVQVNNNYVADQPLEYIVDGVYTLSILFDDNTLKYITLEIVNGTSSTGTSLYGGWAFRIQNKLARITHVGSVTYEIAVKAVKLELGSQQTLAHQDADGNWVLNEIPDYGEQLARCQGYQWVPEKTNNPDFLPRGVGTYVNADDHRISFDVLLFPTTMRATPRITNVRIWDVTNWPYVEVAPENPNPPACASKDGVYQLLLGKTQGIVTGHKYAVWFVADANL